MLSLQSSRLLAMYSTRAISVRVPCFTVSMLLIRIVMVFPVVVGSFPYPKYIEFSDTIKKKD